jgi:hypothetical protein
MAARNSSGAASANGKRWRAFAIVALAWVVAGAFATARTPPAAVHATAARGDGSSGCIACHTGIEVMHPDGELSCVACHGGDADAASKSDAHVKSTRSAARDERIAAPDEDLPWRRFVNPMDLRVARATCGGCHSKIVEHLALSLHGTTAGHLSDGYYEAGLNPRKESTWSVFAVEAPKESSSPLASLRQVPAFERAKDGAGLAAHYADLARKECSQCHLWSEGRAVRGRVGFDGDYRGEGCAACHVPYASDGLSDSADARAVRNEPGHPRQHTLTRAPTTQTCTSCHYGDASIGLNFRGLSQLPPGAPGGPEIKGSTEQLLNRQFYLRDDTLGPPDVHHEKGMHCIDCHTANDLMGDGRLVGAMEDAVEISCVDCHGTFTTPATLHTQRGTPLAHLSRSGDRVVLTSKVDGREHDVKQVAFVVDPKRPEYNPRAAQSMTQQHANIECYTCHASWNPNFLGFHFDRNESLTQLDLLSGKRTPGRVTTQEKVFSTWKSFYAGLNESGRVAPYLTGFSTMGSVTDETGERVLDQVMPVTAAGLSGMTMIHHQMHTTRKSTRSCVECHRSSATWGLGSPNFQLARQLAFVADRRGIETLALDRAKLVTSQPLAKVLLADVTALELVCEPLQGHAETLYAAEGARGIHVFDARVPTELKRVAFVEGIEPLDLVVRGNVLYAAEGAGGLALYDVSKPAAIRRVARVPMFDARALAVQWPYVYVADGPAGLVIVDVRKAAEPRLVSGFAPVTDKGDARSLVDVAVLFQYSRPLAQKRDGTGGPGNTRTEARMLCALLDEARGPVLLDVTEPESPLQLYPDPAKKREPVTEVDERATFRALALQSHVDLAQPTGGTRTAEHDYLYVLREREQDGLYTSFLTSIDVSTPARPKRVGAERLDGASETLVPASFYNPPFLQSVFLTGGADGVRICDATVSAQPTHLGAITPLRDVYAIAVESFPLDRMLDEADRPLKDVSHAGSRWLNLREIERVLSVKTRDAATAPPSNPPATWTARLAFARADTDANAFLEGSELAGPALERTDRDGDGRVSLAEYAVSANTLPERFAFFAPSLDSSGRTGIDGDLSRLFDGVDPYPFDKDTDGRLTRPDMERALFVALDLDGDGKLTRAEASRAPGELRQVRYGGERAAKRFTVRDADGNGTLEARELHLRDEDWRALDANSDGSVALRPHPGQRAFKRGTETADAEWPTRIPYTTLLPPDLTRERLLATFDEDKDGTLTRRELTKRPDLALDMDDDGNTLVVPIEIQSRFVLMGQIGVDASPCGFRARWDLDGDGVVSEKELALPRWLRERVSVGR